MPPRFLLDARKLTHHGIGRYLCLLLQNLPRAAEGFETVVLCREADAKALARLAPGARRVTTHVEAHRLGDRRVVERIVAQVKPDLFHVPHYGPLPRTSCSYLVTIHDLIPLAHPHLVRRTKSWRARILIPRSVRRANRIITVSSASASEIAARFPGAATKTEVIYNSVDPALFRRLPANRLASVRHRLRLPATYLLYLGDYRMPHKNVGRLLDAYAVLARRHSRLPSLVLAGSRSRPAQAALRRRAERLGVSDRVEVRGFVPEPDLPGLYQAALLFAYPSLCEGFGLPVAEAMASGTPILVSRTAALEEVAGGAALSVDPQSRWEISEGLCTLWRDRELRRSLVEAGTRRARLFRTERMVEEHARVYRACLGEVTVDRPTTGAVVG